MNRKELRELMESYRPGPSDLGDAGLGDVEFSALREAAAADPAVRAEMEAVQAWDDAISEAMHDVAVPVGLAERLLGAVELAQCEPAVDAQVTPARQLRDRWWSRWPARVAAAAVSVAALAMVVFYLAGWNDTLTGTEVAQFAQGWIGQLDDEAWVLSTPPGDQHNVQQVLDFPLDGWQRFAAMGDSDAVALRATVPPARSRAWLFVIQTRKGRQLPQRPPSRPNSTTGSICVGVWKSGDHLYVLAVQGTQQTYRRLLKTQVFACAGPERGHLTGNTDS